MLVLPFHTNEIRKTRKWFSFRGEKNPVRNLCQILFARICLNLCLMFLPSIKRGAGFLGDFFQSMESPLFYECLYKNIYVCVYVYIFFLLLSVVQVIKPTSFFPLLMPHLRSPDFLSYSKNAVDVCAVDGWKTPPTNGLSSPSGMAVTFW